MWGTSRAVPPTLWWTGTTRAYGAGPTPFEGETLRARGARRLSVLVMLVLGAGVLPAVTTTSAVAAPDDGTFTTLRGFTPTGAKVRVEPREYVASRVDLSALRGELPAGDASTVVSVPDPSGGAADASASVRTQVMESELAAAHPEIRRTPAAASTTRGARSPSTSPRWASTPPCARRPTARAWYVDPAYNGAARRVHLSYYGAACRDPSSARRARGRATAARRRRPRQPRADAPTPGAGRRSGLPARADHRPVVRRPTSAPRTCRREGHADQPGQPDLQRRPRDQAASWSTAPTSSTSTPTPRRPGRTGRAARTPASRRRPDEFPGELDVCDVCTLANRTVLGQLVGASNYDVGHIGLGVNGGGIAGLGVVGGDEQGAAAAPACPSPMGDFFAIDYVAHEMGHQFGGNHTFNGTQCELLAAATATGAPRSSRARARRSWRTPASAARTTCSRTPTRTSRSARIDEITAYTTATPARQRSRCRRSSLRGFDTDGETVHARLRRRRRRADRDPGTNYTPPASRPRSRRSPGRPVSIAELGLRPYAASSATRRRRRPTTPASR